MRKGTLLFVLILSVGVTIITSIQKCACCIIGPVTKFILANLEKFLPFGMKTLLIPQGQQRIQRQCIQVLV